MALDNPPHLLIHLAQLFTLSLVNLFISVVDGPRFAAHVPILPAVGKTCQARDEAIAPVGGGLGPGGLIDGEVLRVAGAGATEER